MYKMKCNYCHIYYSGQTMRYFGVKLKKHISTRASHFKSVFAIGLADSSHACTSLDNNLQVLHTYSKKVRYLDCLEELEIYIFIKTGSQNLLNEQIQFKSNIVYNSNKVNVKKRGKEE